MAWFTFSRSEGFPTQYSEKDYPVTVDVVEAGIITAFLILYVCFLFASIGTQRTVKLFLFIRVTVSLFLGFCIVFGNFGQEWEVGQIKSKTPYRVGTGHEINATIGIKIGLRSLNVTLKSIEDNKYFKGEVINYNERFPWTWDQGRFGFGPYSGVLQQSFRQAQYRGLPLPILWIVDYFVIDGEGFRFGRFYRTAGWYAHIAMWTALPCWLLANLMFRSVILYGAYFLGIAGGLQLLACLLWYVIRNSNPLVIPFEDGEIVTKFGSSFWLTFTSGLICVIILGVILCMDLYYDAALSIFFGIDPLSMYSEYQLTQAEYDLLRHRPKKRGVLSEENVEMGSMASNLDMNPAYEQEMNEPVIILKRKSTIHPPKLFPRGMRRMPALEDDQQHYGNLSSLRPTHETRR